MNNFWRKLRKIIAMCVLFILSTFRTLVDSRLFRAVADSRLFRAVVDSRLFRAELVLKLLRYLTPDGGHLEFVQNGCHRGSPSWLPREIGRLWSYLALVQNWCLWNDVNNYGVFED